MATRTKAVDRFLSWIQITGWPLPYTHTDTRLAAVDFYRVEKGAPLGSATGPYVLAPGVEVDTELTRVARVLIFAGYNQISTSGKRGKLLDFRNRVADRTLFVRMNGSRVIVFERHTLVARSADELRNYLIPEDAS